MTVPAVTVVIPLRDKRQYLLRAVSSVLRQGWRDLELIVVDDGSTDGGAELLARLDEPRIRWVRTENRGPGAARNTGARLSRSPWLAFLDADDEWDTSFLVKAVDAMRGAPATVLVYCDARARHAAPLHRNVASGPIADYFGTRMRHGIAVSSSSNLVRRDAFAACGGFREDFRYAEDIEAWVRLACLGPFYFIADTCTIIEIADRTRITARASALERAEGLGRVYESFLRSVASGAMPASQQAGCRRFMQQQRCLQAAHFASAGLRREALRILREVPLGSHTWRAYARCLRQVLVP